MPIDLANLRREYMRAGLEESGLERDPLTQLGKWLDDAVRAGVPLPNAMTLATATRSGRPSARAVLLKGCDARGLVFYTNYDSRKGRELAENPRAMLLFCWEELERQVRIEGPVERTGADESDDYFASRPLGARLSAIVSPQSEPVAARSDLEAKFAQAAKRLGAAPARPAHWGGFRVLPEWFEFWQGRADRLHDRLCYAREGGAWRIGRLAP